MKNKMKQRKIFKKSLIIFLSSFILTGCDKNGPVNCAPSLYYGIATNISGVKSAGENKAAVDVYLGFDVGFRSRWKWNEEEKSWTYKTYEKEYHFVNSELRLERDVFDLDENIIDSKFIHIDGLLEDEKYQFHKSTRVDICDYTIYFNNNSFITDEIDFNQFNLNKGEIRYCINLYDNLNQKPITYTYQEDRKDDKNEDDALTFRYFTIDSRLTFGKEGNSIVFTKIPRYPAFSPIVKDVNWTI